MVFKLDPLPYAYDALEPYIDAKTMEIHYTKHHAGYVAKLNAALEGYPALAEQSVEELVRNYIQQPEEVRAALRNQGGGHYNHTFFWQILGPASKGPRSEVSRALVKNFGEVEAFKEQFNDKASSVFGSGWAWLCITPNDKLEVITTHNQDSPISSGFEPLLGLDVWEHAYYLKYQNKRLDYIQSWWNVVNWDKVEEHYRRLTTR